MARCVAMRGRNLRIRYKEFSGPVGREKGREWRGGEESV